MIAFFQPAASAEKPIIIGAPLSTAFLYGWDAERGIKLAVEEINAAGGVTVGGKKRPFAVELIDTRDLEPQVPVSEALLAVEKLILEKKADFLIGGPVRSEAALAAMDLLQQVQEGEHHDDGHLTPAYTKKVEDNYAKYKYCFRNTSHVGVMISEFTALIRRPQEDAGLQPGLHHGAGRCACAGRRRGHEEDPYGTRMDRG